MPIESGTLARVNGDAEVRADEPALVYHEAPASTPGVATRSDRIAALFEVLLCSDYPTQLVLGAALAKAGFAPAIDSSGELSVPFVVALSLLDTIALLGLIVVFLRARGESVRELVVGDRRVGREVGLGVRLSVAAMVLGVSVLATLHLLAPTLRTVETNPLEALIRTPAGAAWFALVVVIAGGVREEIQRAFLLRRFEQSLGGMRVGVVVTSLAFGMGHLMQGMDAAVATGVLGAFWAVVYLRRRSAVAPIVSHAGFNLLQLAQFLVVGAASGRG
jgi:membrane protease YdiL (CAAX protease family)